MLSIKLRVIYKLKLWFSINKYCMGLMVCILQSKEFLCSCFYIFYIIGQIGFFDNCYIQESFFLLVGYNILQDIW